MCRGVEALFDTNTSRVMQGVYTFPGETEKIHKRERESQRVVYPIHSSVAFEWNLPSITRGEGKEKKIRCRTRRLKLHQSTHLTRSLLAITRSVEGGIQEPVFSILPDKTSAFLFTLPSSNDNVLFVAFCVFSVVRRHTPSSPPSLLFPLVLFALVAPVLVPHRI